MGLTIRPRRVLAVAAQTLATAVGFVVVVLALSDRRHVQPSIFDERPVSPSPSVRFEQRRRLLRLSCDGLAASEPQLTARKPRDLGVEVVFLRGQPAGVGQKALTASVCVPHKVGSNSWGKFSRAVASDVAAGRDNGYPDLRVVVVRHPLERLVSVYKMIFESWCDKDRFLAKQWNNVCQKERILAFSSNHDDISNDGLLDSASAKDSFSASHFLAAMLDEQRTGNDRFMVSLWKHFHPHERLVDPETQLRFSFSQFVQYLVNASVVGDPKGLSYHWAPFVSECALCGAANITHVLHMETFDEDLDALLLQLGLADKRALFPHTHSQFEGNARRVAAGYFSTITKDQVDQLHQKYRLDHELFGYDIEEFRRNAKP